MSDQKPAATPSDDLELPEEPKIHSGWIDDKLYPMVTWKDYDRLLSLARKLKHDIEAYRGALGYSVRGDHDSRLSDGTFPQCGLCEANFRRAEQAERKLAEAEEREEKNKKDAEEYRSMVAGGRI